MGKASRTKQEYSRRERIAAQRTAARRAEQRRRLYIAGGAIAVVIAVVIGFVVAKGSGSGSGSGSAGNGPTGTALASLTRQVTSVPIATQDKVGGGSIARSDFIPGSQIAAASASGSSYFATVSDTPLTSGGKPEVLYVGAEYCPFCAAQRWAMIVSLSRFGTFAGLRTVHSSSKDIDPNTPTFTFYGSRYTSKYLTFTSVEQYSDIPKNNFYAPLQKTTSAQDTLMTKYDPGNPSQGTGGAIPFLDLGNKYIEVGNLSPFGPQDLSGKNWNQIADALTQPSSTIAKGVLGSANYMTAGICTLTNNLPASACTPSIKALESKL